MEYAAFVFAVFGLMAYLQIPSLKKRINDLERELASSTGTSYHYERKALSEAARNYIGEKVDITLDEDHLILCGGQLLRAH